MYCKFPRQDLVARLSNSILRYKNIPYRIEVDDDYVVLRSLATGRANHRILPSDPEFDISTPPMGYVNFDNECYYLCRVPCRRYKQGIDSSNTSFYRLPLTTKYKDRDDLERNHASRIVRDRGDLLYSKNTQNMMTDKYESSEKVVSDLRNDVCRSRAISKDIAFAIDDIGMITVFYKQEIVGHILPGCERDVIRIPSGGNHAAIISANIEGFGIEVE